MCEREGEREFELHFFTSLACIVFRPFLSPKPPPFSSSPPVSSQLLGDSRVGQGRGVVGSRAGESPQICHSASCKLFIGDNRPTHTHTHTHAWLLTPPLTDLVPRENGVAMYVALHPQRHYYHPSLTTAAAAAPVTQTRRPTPCFSITKRGSTVQWCTLFLWVYF